MQTLLWPTAAALALAGIVLTGTPALAQRPTCDQLVQAQAAGQSNADVAKSFDTTQARVQACAEIAQQHARQNAERARYDARRTERGLPTL